MAENRYPVESFKFFLRVDGKYDLACKSVHNFNYGKEYEYIQEGGLNDYVHMRRKPASRPNTFQVERYVGMDNVDYLRVGREFVLPVLLFVSPGKEEEETGRTYAFIGCTVTEKSYGELNAEGSSLLVETVTIAYRQLVCVDRMPL